MFRNTGIGTSLLLIAAGAVLAFAVNVGTEGIDLNTIGVILMLVGILGLAITLAASGAFDLGGSGYDMHDHVSIQDRGLDTTGLNYHDEPRGSVVERETRTRL